MCPPNTDPWTPAVGNDTDPDATVADDAAGLARPARARDTLVDAVEPDTIGEERGPADQGLAEQLRRLGGRAPQLANVQADSAGRGAASYAVVAKPIKSRAVSRTEPFGVIVVPDSSPPQEQEREREPETDAKPAASSSQDDPDVTVPTLTTIIERGQARQQAAAPTVPRAAPPARPRGHHRVVVFGALGALTVLATCMFFFRARPGVGAGGSATEQAAVGMTPAVPPERPSSPPPTLPRVVPSSAGPLSPTLAPAAPRSSSLPRALTAGASAPASSTTKPREVPAPRAIDSGTQTPPHPTAVAPRSEDTKRTFE